MQTYSHRTKPGLAINTARSCLAVLACLMMALAAASAHAQQAYALLNGGSGAEIGTLDLSTGAYTSIGSTTLNGTPVVIDSLSESASGILYGGSTGDSNLYQIDTGTGQLTLIGNNGVGPLWLGSTSTSLYGFTAANLSNMYSVDGGNATATLVGSTGGGVPMGYFSISTKDPALYIAAAPDGTTNATLYTVDTSTGAISVVGSTGVTGIDAMGNVNGTLYATSDTTGNLYSINPSTGVATLITALSNIGSNFVYGLAEVTPVPETRSLPSMIMGITGLGWLAGKRRSSTKAQCKVG